MMWTCKKHIETVEMDGEWLVMDAEKYVMTKLNEVGGWLFSRIQAGEPLETLVPALSAEYGIPEARASSDILAFIDQLAACGLIEHAS